MLKQRIITALILGVFAIAALFNLPLFGFAILMAIVVALGAWEWGPLMSFASNAKRAVFVLTNLGLIAAIWYWIGIDHFWLAAHEINLVAQGLLWLAVSWWLLSAMLTLLYPKFTSVWGAHRSIRGVFGWLTLVPTWVAFMVLRTSDYNLEPNHGAFLLLYLFMMVWAADVGAYFVGKSIGRRKLLPRVSPGKTLEGFIGGVITAIFAVMLVGYFQQWQSEQFVLAIVLALIISTVSVLGDLNESMFKREAGVKDSGALLPGHGGVLDRIDSLTATAPVFALCYVAYGW